MSRENKNFDNEQMFKLSDTFKKDLKNLYKTSSQVPPEVDRAILYKATQKLNRPRKRFYILRWAGPVAAAAAVIIFAVIFMNQGSPADIDRNGRVDILDAFKLAKQIQSENTVNKKWDINGDGRVDNDDVQTIAYAAVSLDKGV
jgi:hypothetical protein